MSEEEKTESGSAAPRRLEALDLPYRPINPRHYNPNIALIGCGGITAHHLTAYRSAGYRVVALCDLDPARVEERRVLYYPDADAYTDYREVLKRDDIEVVDIATHPAERIPIIEAALLAGKHVLSQKPFVLDLDTGERLCELAEKQGVRLAVNQNGRWAPHVAYMRLAVASGLLGSLTSADLSVHFDHNWVVDTPFDLIPDLNLYDFAIHWFDMLTCYFGDAQPQSVYAATAMARGQLPHPPLLAHAVVEYPDAQATLSFNGSTRVGHDDRTTLIGTVAAAHSYGSSLQEQGVDIVTAEGVISPRLVGNWFPDGFHGTMAELLCAIEEGRAPTNNGVENLRSLALAFAAIGSAHEGKPKVPGSVRRLPGTFA